MTKSYHKLAIENNWIARGIPDNADLNKTEGPLSGLTYFAKDLFDIKNEITVAGCQALKNNPPATEDAQIIRQLKSMGAILLGMTNMDPLAYGFITRSPLYGTAKNPYAQKRICGGSSGGSAAVVAAGLADFSLGTDTSGSIRVPAAFNGVFGIKPTYNKLSSNGVFPLSQTMDRVGLFTASASMLKKVFLALSEDKLKNDTPEGPLKIARLGGYFNTGLEENISDAIDDFCHKLNVDNIINIENVNQARGAAYIIVAAEAAAVHNSQLLEQPDLFDDETRTRLLAARLIPEEWVSLARNLQNTFIKECTRALEHFDVLIAPTVSSIAPSIKDLDAKTSPLRAMLGRFTQPISLCGFPVVSFPIPTTHGLPTAVQLIGRPGSDHKLIDLACMIENSGLFDMCRMRQGRPKLGKQINSNQPEWRERFDNLYGDK